MKDERSRGWRFCNRLSKLISALTAVGYASDDLILVGSQSELREVLLSVNESEITNVSTLPVVAEVLGEGERSGIYGVDFMNREDETPYTPDDNSFRGLMIFIKNDEGYPESGLGCVSFGRKDHCMAGYFWVSPDIRLDTVVEELLKYHVPFVVTEE